MKVLHFESIYCRGAYFKHEVIDTSATSLEQFLREEFYADTKDDFEEPDGFDKFILGKTNDDWFPGVEWAGNDRCSVNNDEAIDHFLVLTDDSIIKTR